MVKDWLFHLLLMYTLFSMFWNEIKGILVTQPSSTSGKLLVEVQPTRLTDGFHIRPCCG